MNVKGGEFEKGLHTGYLKLAKAEHSEYDWGDAVQFEDRAKLAAMGKPTAPEMLSARAVPKKHKKPLTAGYMRLTEAMAKGGALKNAGVKNELRTAIHGEGRNAVATKDGIRQRLNRRVEILVKQ